MGEQSEANPEPKRKTTADEGYKRKAEQPPKVVADFLQRNTKQGWASKAKPIPTQIERRKQNKLLPTNPKKRNKHLQYIHKTIFIKTATVMLGIMVVAFLFSAKYNCEIIVIFANT